MKKLLFVSLLVWAVIWTGLSTGYAQVDPREELKPKILSQNLKPKPKPGARVDRTADVIIETGLEGCVVFIGEKEQPKRTNQHGVVELPIPITKSGDTLITVSKEGYETSSGRFPLQSGIQYVLSVPMRAAQVVFVVRTDSGAQIKVKNIATGKDFGPFKAPMITTMLDPGSYSIEISKPGFETQIKESVEVKPGQPVELTIPLKVLDIKALTAQLEKYFRAGDYKKVIESGNIILGTQPDAPRVHALLGNSYFKLKQFNLCVDHWVKALTGGETVTIELQHHHGGKGFFRGVREDLRPAKIILRKDTLEFQCTKYPEKENFPATSLGEIDIKFDPNSAGRVTLVRVDKKGKSKDKVYDLNPPLAQMKLAPSSGSDSGSDPIQIPGTGRIPGTGGRSSTMTRIPTCPDDSCRAQGLAIFELLDRLKKQAL